MAAIIFDFDGTIADSFDYVADFLAREAKLPLLSKDQKQRLRGLSMTAMARRLKHHWWRLPGLFLKGRRQMGRMIGQLEPFAGMTEVIRKLHAEGHELFVVSSNSVANIHAFLHRHDLHTYFLEIYGGIGLFGKAAALRRLLREQRLETVDATYVGDEVRDVRAAQSLKLRIIAVTWGFAQATSLHALKPTATANSPAELIAILEEI